MFLVKLRNGNAILVDASDYAEAFIDISFNNCEAIYMYSSDIKNTTECYNITVMQKQGRQYCIDRNRVLNVVKVNNTSAMGAWNVITNAMINFQKFISHDSRVHNDHFKR